MVLTWKLDPPDVNIALLMHAEAFAGEAQTLLSALKIPKALLLVLLAIVFTCSILSVREQWLAVFVRGLSPGLARLARVLTRARAYNKPLSSLVAGLTAATLFTFFGAIPGLPKTDLQARLRDADHTSRRAAITETGSGPTMSGPDPIYSVHVMQWVWPLYQTFGLTMPGGA